MRKFLIAGALLVVLAGTSFAIELTDLPFGRVRMQFDDLTTLYVPEGVNGHTWQPLPPTTIPDQSLEGVAQLRSIFQVVIAGSAGPANQVITQGAWFPVGEELTGTITGLTVSAVARNYVDIDGDNTPDRLLVTVEYAPTPGAAATDVDTSTRQVPPAESGGRFTMYSDTSPDYPTSSPPPDAWFQSSYDTDAPRLEYPNVGLHNTPTQPDNEARVFLDGTLVALSLFGKVVSSPDTVLLQSLEYSLDEQGNPTGLLFGTYEAMVNSIRTDQETFGPYSDVMEYTRLSLEGLMIEDWAGRQSQYSNNLSALYGDAHLFARLDWDPAGEAYGGWMFHSTDPFDYARGPIPEPMTVVLLGGALLGLARRRRKRA